MLKGVMTLLVAVVGLAGPGCGKQDSGSKTSGANPVSATLQKRKIETAKMQVQKIGQAVTLYATRNDYPEALKDLVDAKLVRSTKSLTDPWGKPLSYAYPSKRAKAEFDLCSSGPDKTAGTEDDICRPD